MRRPEPVPEYRFHPGDIRSGFSELEAGRVKGGSPLGWRDIRSGFSELEAAEGEF